MTEKQTVSNISTINIRQARASDREKLSHIFLETRLSTFYWQDSRSFQLSDFEKQTQDEMVFLAENLEKEVLGFISVYEEDQFIHHLYVSLEHQRKGIGQLLIQSLFLWLPLPYRLKCLTKNHPACTFYRKNGWVVTGEGTHSEGDYFLFELA